jgi:phosphoribosylaminoimidazolecarboxamide formyltransferase / IMP cyclohydrolase
MASPIRRALISVSDKTGLIDFARGLAALGIEIVSTGGTAAALKRGGIAVVDVSIVTGFPEIMDGRVKTLHPKIHGGLLGIPGKAAHEEAMRTHDIAPIGLLVVNLYPFEATVAKGAGWEEIVENIDVGGPAMIRAAAKNHDAVTVVVSPEDYGAVLDEMRAHGGATSNELRRRLAAAAFARTAAYDAAIAQRFAVEAGETMPRHFAVGGKLVQRLRYGENPHQAAALYATGETRPGAVSAERVQGKELSYNNINDTDAAFECVAEFSETACVIVKHANPCGVAVAPTLREAYLKALACDPTSAFGGIVAVNKSIDAETAKEIVKIFTEVIIAPEATEDARAIIAAKKNLRLLITGAVPDAGTPGLSLKSVAGGLLVQSRDNGGLAGLDLKVVTKRAPSAEERADLKFAWRVAKHVKSNAIVYAKDGATVGIGAGQMSRVDSSRIAAMKGGKRIKGSAVASDAFFPFADGLLAAAEAGATAVIQPGGSLRDDETIAAADKAKLAMIFTGMRHFRH